MGFFSGLQQKKEQTSSATTQQTFQTQGTKSAYQQNLSSPVETQNKTVSTRDVLGMISKIGTRNQVAAQTYFQQFQDEMSRPDSQWYNPYNQPTNRAVSNLAALGFDTNNLNDDWWNANHGWVSSNLVYNGTTNTPSSVKKGTRDQKIAYELYQWHKSEETTRKAEQEWQALQDELSYWAKDTSRNYSDDQIYERVYGKDGEKLKDKYPTLYAMNQGKKNMELTELNRAVDFSTDAMYGVMWAARNPEYQGNIWGAMANSALGTGNQWAENPEITAKLNENDDNTYSPYSVGMTLEQEGLYFNTLYFDQEMIDEIKKNLDWNDKTAKEMINNVQNAEDFTVKAEGELANLNAKINDWLDNDKYTEKDIMDLVDKYMSKECKSLLEMDKQLRSRTPSSTTRAIDYKYDELKQRIHDRVAERDAQKNAVDAVCDEIDAITTVAPYIPSNGDIGADAQNAPNYLASGGYSDAGIKIPSQQERDVYKAQDAELKGSLAAVDGELTPAESTQMKNAGTVSWNPMKEIWQQVASLPAAMIGLAQRNGTAAAKLYVEGSMASMRFVNGYDNVKNRLETNQQMYDELSTQLGDISYLNKEVEQQKQFNVGDITFVMQYNEGDFANGVAPHYEITNFYAPGRGSGMTMDEIIEYGNDQAAIDEAEKLRKEANYEAQKILSAHNRLNALGEDAKTVLAQYQNLESKIQLDEAYLANNQTEYDQKKALLNSVNRNRDLVTSTNHMLGADTTMLEQAQVITNYLSQYYDEPPLYNESESMSQYYDRLVEESGGNAPYSRSEWNKMNLEAIDLQLGYLDMSEEWIKENNVKLPDNVIRNMQYTRQDLENKRIAYEYASILSDTDPKEMEAAIAAGKAFEQKNEGQMHYWTELFNDKGDYYTLNYRDRYVLPDEGIKRDVVSEEDENLYYYLLGKKVLEMGDSLDDAIMKINTDPDITREAVREVFSDAKKFQQFMEDENTGYGLWSIREYEGSAGMGGEMVQNGQAVEANVMSTLVTPAESIANIYSALDYLISGKRFNPKSFTARFSAFKETTRAETRKAINNYFDGEDTLMAKLANLGYEIYCNRGDSLMNSMVFGSLFHTGVGMIDEFLGASPMGATAAMNAAYQAIENGASTEQAWLIAGATFLAETATEAVTLSNIKEAMGFEGELTGDSLKSIVTNWLTQSGVEEMIGESANDVIEDYAQQLAKELYKNPNYKTDHDNLVAKYVGEGMSIEDAEATASRDEIQGVLHTALVSYLSSGTEVIMGGTKAVYNSYMTAKSQTADTDQSAISKMYENWNNRDNDEASQKKEEAFAKQEEQREQAQEAAATEQQKGYATDVEILETVMGINDASARSAAMAATLVTENDKTGNDQANAAAVHVEDAFENGAQDVQEIMYGGMVGDVDAIALKRGIQYAALGGENSACNKLVQSDEFKAADPVQKAVMLSQAVVTDMWNTAVNQNVQSVVRENRIAEKVKDLVANGALQGTKTAAEAVTKAEAESRQAQEDLESKQAEAEAAQQALDAAVTENNENPSDENAKQVVSASVELGQRDESAQQYEQHKAKLDAALEKAEAACADVKQKELAGARQQAEQIIDQEDQQIAEEKARIAEQERLDAEVRKKAFEEQQLNNNISRMDADDFISQYYPDATDEEKKTIRNAFVQARFEMGYTAQGFLQRKSFANAIEQKFGFKIQVGDTTEGGTKARKNAQIDKNTGTITLDTHATLDDMFYAILPHEVTHGAEKSNTYSELADAVLQGLYGEDASYEGILKAMENGDMSSRIAQDILAKKRLYDSKVGGNHTYREMAQEVVADGVGKILSGDQKAMDQLVAKKPNVAKRILNSIKNFLRKAAGFEAPSLTQAQQIADLLEQKLKDAGFANESETKESRNTRYSIANDYMDAVDSGNMEEAQRIVDEKAKEAGYNITAVHGTNAEFNSFEKGDIGYHFGTEEQANNKANQKVNNYGGDKRMIRSYIKMDNPLVLDFDAYSWDAPLMANRYISYKDHEKAGMPYDESETSTKVYNMFKDLGITDSDIERLRSWDDGNQYFDEILERNGYDGIVYKNEIESNEGAYSYIVPLNKRGNIKVADAVTYDENGNVIPLDERFNESNEDIRYSVATESAIVTDDMGTPLAQEFDDGTAVVSPENFQYSLSSFDDDEQERVRQELLKKFPKKDVDKYLSDALSIASMIAADKVRLDFKASDNQVFLKPNNDYYFTLDASTLCAKRLLYQGTFDYVQHALPDEVFTPEDLIDLVNIMNDMGYETPCGICYVESRRRWLDTYAQKFLDTLPEEGRPSIDDLTTSDGLEKLRHDDPDMYKKFVDAMNKKGTANPKVVQLRTEYRGDISKMTAGQIQKVKDIGGLRIQSFSDFETPHLLDMMQAVMDMSAAGLTSQAYTKVPNFAWVFGNTGIKINLSLIGKGTGLDENGNLVFDNREGMNFDEAMQIRNQYGKNVGTILVGINDDHIVAAMGDPRIDFIIPFHKSGWSAEELRKMPTLNNYNDYTDTQNERLIIGRKEDGSYETESFKKHKDRTKESFENFQPVGKNGYWDFDKSGEENARNYLKMCADAKRVPKFSQFLVDNGDGSFSLPEGTDKRSTSIREGYWKTLIDFKMYENDGYGRTNEDGTKTTVKGAAQTEVTPNINMEEAYRVLNEYKLGRQMPDQADGTKGRFIPMESNNDVPVATAAGDRYIELIKNRRAGVKPNAPGPDTLEADLPVNPKASAFGASQAPAILGNTENETQETGAAQQAAMAINAETGETERVVRNSLPEEEYKYSRPSDAPYLSAVNHGDMEEAQRMVDEKAKEAGYTKAGYHGTLSAGFTIFDKAKAGIGGNSGAGFYFSSNPDDSEANYSDVEGADNWFKTQHLVDKIYEAWRDSGEDSFEYEGYEIDENTDLDQIAKEILTKNPQTYNVYLDQGKPYIRDFDNSTNLIQEAIDNFYEGDFNPDDYDSEEDYADDIAMRRSDEIYEAISNAVYNGIADVDSNYEIVSNVNYDDIIGKLAEIAIDYETLQWRDLIKVLEDQYIEIMTPDMDESTDGSHEIARAIVEAFGFDSIEDREVSKKFNQLKNMGNTGDTVHYIMFHPEQIKLADPVTYRKDENGNDVPIPLSERFKKTSNDIRYSLPSENILNDQIRYYLENQNVPQQTEDQGYDIRKSMYSDNLTVRFNRHWTEEEDAALRKIGMVPYNDSHGWGWRFSRGVKLTEDQIREALSSARPQQPQRYPWTDSEVDQIMFQGGQNPNVPVGEIPSATLQLNPAEETKQRQWGREGAQQSDELSEQAKQYVLSHNEYTPDTNAEQLDRAVEWIRGNRGGADPDGYYTSLQKVTSSSFNYRSADGQARMVAVMGMAVAKNDVAGQVQLAKLYNPQGTTIAQALQARKLWKLMTPEGRVQTLNNMLKVAQDDLNAKGTDVELKLSDWIYMAATAATQDGAMEAVQKAAAKEIAEQLPANWRDKMRSWRMLSMLGNPRTHIRNVVGNALFIPAVGLKNKIGAVGEIVYNKTHGTTERSKTLSLFLDKDIRNFAREDAVKMKDTLTGEAKYNENNAVQKEQKAFKGLLQAVIDFNSNWLEREDWTFLKGHYRRALGGWMQANGYTVEQLQNNPSLLEKGRAYAIEEAQKATYRDFNKLAATLNKVSRDGGVAGFLVDAALPFKKTPANILKRGIEYSPVGLMKSVTSDLYHLKQWKDAQNGKLNAIPEKALSPTQFVDRLSSGLSGSVVLGIGALLASAGIITCGLDDDDDEFEKAKGAQKYAIKILGTDVTFTIDWAAPMSMPLFVGASLYDQFTKEGDFDIEALVDAFGNITEPVFNLSMLDGVNSLFKTSQYDDTNTLTQIFAKIGSNYVTSYVPSALGAATRTFFDDTQRKAFVESGKGTGVLGTARYAIEQVENKIPGLSRTNIPIRDIWGNANTSSFFERLIENFISPGYFNEYKDDPIINEMSRLYDLTGDSSLVPSDPNKSVTYNKQKYVLSAEQWDTYKERRGQTAQRLLGELINTADYKNASFEVQAEMIKNVWSYADKVGKSAIIPGYKMDDLGANPVLSITKDSKVDGYKDEMIKALNANDFETYATMIQALRDEKVADKDIKKKIGDTYRDKYKEAYRNKQNTVMAEIEDILDNTGFDFDYYDWQLQEDKKNKNSGGGGGGGRPSAIPERPASDKDWGRYMDELDNYWASYDFDRNDPTEQNYNGTIDLNDRQVVHNEDGSISTEYSFSFWDDDAGKEVLIPRVVNGRIVSEQEAKNHYYKTGEHLGMFDDWHDADEYAMMLHNRNNWYYNR